MVALFKGKITSDFFQIALLLTLFGGELYRPQNNLLARNRINNYRNDVNSTEDILSLSQGYHYFNNRIQNYYEHPSPDLPGKTIRSEYGEYSQNVTYDEDAFDYVSQHEQILEELRRLTLDQRSNTVIDLKALPVYPDISTYLNNSTNRGPRPEQTITIAALPEIPPFAAGHSNSWPSAPNLNLHFTPLSIITDDGHEEILNPEREDDSEDEDIALGLYYPEMPSKMELMVMSENHPTTEQLRTPREVPQDSGYDLLDLDLDFLEDHVESEKPQNASTSVPDIVEGAAGPIGENGTWTTGTTSFLDEAIAGASASSWGLHFDSDYQLPMEFHDVPEHIPFRSLEVFQDITDEDLMNTISPYEIHMSSDLEEGTKISKNPNTSEPGSVLDASNDTTRTRSSDSGSSSHDEVASSGDDEAAKVPVDYDTADASSFDELWEADSGIFDTLLEDSPTNLSPEHTFDFADTFDPDSPFELSADETVVDGEAVLHDWIGENTEESTSRSPSTSPNLLEENMIQTAPIHTSARPPIHPAQPRGFQVHARMPGLLRGGSMDQMDQRWQELVGLFNLQSPHDPNGGPLNPSLPHHFGGHHHHLHHPSTLHHHHPMHHPSFAPSGPTATPYTANSARSVLLQNATLPTSELNASYGNVSMGPPPNLGSAVASSMHITNSSDPLTDPSAHYKMIEPAHDMLYYQNSSNAELNNQTTEGFLSSILNDDDLQLMDMAMNEGMYTMRMLDNSGSGALPSGASGPANLPHEANCLLGNSAASLNVTTSEDRMEASSDSAVSSMGSERAPPMTDTNLTENDWESDHHPHGSSYSLDYSSAKLRGYDYYGKGESSHRVVVPVAQKKHHMFGKRFQQEQGSSSLHSNPYSLSHGPTDSLGHPYPSTSGLHHPSSSSMEPLEMKYSCSLDFARQHDVRLIGGSAGSGGIVHANHTYSLPPSHPENPLLSARSPRVLSKDKHQKTSKDYKSEEHLSRDEKRARTMGLPMMTDEIINLPMDEFNERLSKYDLTEAQLSLIRDIRRRGKNKVAAQNCRKRKLDQITQLETEVQRIRDKKQSLMREQDNLLTRRNVLRDKYSHLYRYVFQALKDPAGNSYNLNEYSLQQTADGSIILVPKNLSQPSTSGCNDSLEPMNSSRRPKSKDDMKKDSGS